MATTGLGLDPAGTVPACRRALWHRPRHRPLGGASQLQWLASLARPPRHAHQHQYLRPADPTRLPLCPSDWISRPARHHDPCGLGDHRIVAIQPRQCRIMIDALGEVVSSLGRFRQRAVFIQPAAASEGRLSPIDGSFIHNIDRDPIKPRDGRSINTSARSWASGRSQSSSRTTGSGRSCRKSTSTMRRVSACTNPSPEQHPAPYPRSPDTQGARPDRRLKSRSKSLISGLSAAARSGPRPAVSDHRP